MELPIVDFSKCGMQIEELDLNQSYLKEIGDELYKAFSSSGFAYVKGSGIPRETIQRMDQLCEIFFNKSFKYKESFIHDVTFGYDWSGLVRTNPERPYDTQEGFHIDGDALSKDSHNWPDIPNFEKLTREFAEICKKLSLRMLRALGMSMELKDPHILGKSHNRLNKTGNQTLLKFMNYPGVSPSEQLLPNQARIGEHTDWGTVTLLFQDNVGGLQIEAPNGTFVDVTPIEDTIVVNVGDMLSMWSNYDLKSTIHRVMIPTDLEHRSKPRRSMAYFVSADDETVLSKFEYQSIKDYSLYNKGTNVEGAITAYEYFKSRYQDNYKEIKYPSKSAA